MSAVDTPHLILFEFFIKIPSPVTRALCFPTCLYILCVCVYGHVRVCLQRHYRHLLSLRCSKLSVTLHFSVHILMSIFSLFFFTTLFSFLFLVLFILEVCGGLVGKSSLWTEHPAADNPVPFSSSIFCARDPDAALNAGHHRLLTELGEKGGVVLCVCLKEAHAIKNSLPSCQCNAIKNSWAGAPVCIQPRTS